MSEQSVVVKTQGELDAALAARAVEIIIDSPRGMWLEISRSGSATVSAYGSATVTAYGSATVTAYGSATVTAYDSATVTAYDSATVTAYDSATVTAYDSATVTATKYVAVHLHSQRVNLAGAGHIIDVTDLDLQDPATWLEYRGVEVVDGVAYLFKAVNDEWVTGGEYSGTDYSPGSTPEAADWSTVRACGGGLHLSQSPVHALGFHPKSTRFVKVGVRVDEIVTLEDKVKAKRVVVAAVEVDVHGRLVEVAA